MKIELGRFGQYDLDKNIITYSNYSLDKKIYNLTEEDSDLLDKIKNYITIYQKAKKVLEFNYDLTKYNREVNIYINSNYLSINSIEVLHYTLYSDNILDRDLSFIIDNKVTNDNYFITIKEIEINNKYYYFINGSGYKLKQSFLLLVEKLIL
jgi:hypothetical protein